MSRKKKHPEHVNHERWLVSYADFITLLFAFFVVLFASSQSDKKKKTQLAAAMQAAFDHSGIFDPHSKTPPLEEAAGALAQHASPPVPTAVEQLRQTEQRIREIIKAQVAARHLADGLVSTHLTQEGLVISMREAGFFDSGSATVRNESLDVLNAVAAALPHQPMRVEGHTDNNPIHTALFATNWELSTARAATITRLLLVDRATTPEQISAAGYAEFHPVADNATADGRAKNRRVDIVLLSPTVTLPTPQKP
ncbi:OmpA family protein [Granulicella sp. WH15]|uniref:flagellar motor protein MotB n=1 Tax=Granulicella sp. WH15 TaxID=2602070 RepID=UPI0013672261|nr:flagellar motor protein MotB [Granulicella sp. WH15]QHN04056.1 OmpA family protein [Granulicella sp. WH15]